MGKKPLLLRLKSILDLRHILGREAFRVGTVAEPLGSGRPSFDVRADWRANHAMEIRYARKCGREAKAKTKSNYVYYGKAASWEFKLRPVKDELKKRSNEHFKFLDVGPGVMRYASSLIKDLPNAEVHSLSPEQINPIVRKGSKERRVPRLTHHVSTVELCDPKKLGKFDVIHSSFGIPYYGAYPLESVLKLAGMLNKGGVAMLQLPKNKLIFNDMAPILRGKGFECKWAHYALNDAYFIQIKKN